MSRSRRDMTSVRAGLAARAAEVATALLGEPNAGLSTKRELRFGHKGSLAVVIAGPKAGSWFDHEAGAGGNLLALIERTHRVGLSDAIAYAGRFVGQAPMEPAPAPRPRAPADDGTDRARMSRIALDLWNEAMPIAGTVAARYLAGRRLVELAPGIDGPVLRFHPSCPYRGARQACMLALLRNIVNDEPRAIQRTALTRDGRKIGRAALGPKSGAVIKLSADAHVADHLTIGEGLETTLAGMMLGYVPAWAVGDAGELARFPVLNGAEALTILVDHDESGTGQRAVPPGMRLELKVA